MGSNWKVPKADSALLRNIDQAHVEQTLAKLAPYIGQTRWLAKSNRYSKHTVTRLNLDTRPPRSLNGKHLAQYIAASTILHCADGWSYLGRAINCLLKGDPHRVVHLAYYAELRAALSLLACEGIGVFREWHFTIDGVDSARLLPAKQQTHRAAWSYLKYWSTLKRSGDLFSSVITPGGIALSDWFDPAGGAGRVIRPQAKFWFGQWSMDLGLFSDDRDARNDSSYRPDGIPDAWYLNAPEALALATELWEVCEPSQATLFDGTDRHILRIATEAAFTGVHGSNPTQDRSAFVSFVSSLVDPLALSASAADEWKSFLLRDSVPDDPKIFSYSSKNPMNRMDGHAAVLSRAIFLLRVATGSTLRLVRSSGIAPDTLEFWWNKLGVNRGLWDGPMQKADLLDLWNDISALFEDIRLFQNSTPEPQQTFQLIGNKIPQVVVGLGGCERVAIWSLTP
jgi:hypothetical protein